MATNETLIPVPGRLHSVADGEHLAGADEIYDDDLQRLQSAINADVKVMGASGSNHSKGLVPDPGSTAGTSKYLREDGTWQEVSVAPEKLGFGIGTCSTASGTTAKEVSITGYLLVKNGFVAVTFENDVPAGATLNVSDTGAKPIYFKGFAIVNNIIKGGDTVTFCYDGTNYVVANPIGLNRITFHTYADAEKTTPIAAIISVTHPDGSSEQVRVGSTGVTTIYGRDGSYAMSSLYATLDTNSFIVNGNHSVDIVVTNTQYTDLGLPSGTLWARGNLVKDAQGNYSTGNPEDGYTYFSWGNIDGYNSSEVGTGTGQYSFTSANYASTAGKQLTASFASNDADHDAAYARLGGDWHMPTKGNCDELLNADYTTISASTINGVDGSLITSKINGNTLFIPRAGVYIGTNCARGGGEVWCWASNYSNSALAYYMDNSRTTAAARERGLSIRPVL